MGCVAFHSTEMAFVSSGSLTNYRFRRNDESLYPGLFVAEYQIQHYCLYVRNEAEHSLAKGCEPCSRIKPGSTLLRLGGQSLNGS